MARGTRAPSQNAFRGRLGRTQQTTVQVSGPRGDLVPVQVFTTIDAVSDPELVERLHSDDPGRALNTITFDTGAVVHVAVPVLYHDPAAEVLVLVLGDAHRHREFDERIRIYERLRDDDAEIPSYAKELAVVYGAVGLREYLELRAQEALEAARRAELGRDGERKRLELAAREAELDRRAAELERLQADHDRARVDHDKRARELDRRAAELDVGKIELASRLAEVERSRAEVERGRAEIRHRLAQARLGTRELAVADEPPQLPPPTEDSVATVIGPPPERDLDLATRPIAKLPLDDLEAGLQASINGHTAPRPRDPGADRASSAAGDTAAADSPEPGAATAAGAGSIDSGLLTGVVDALDALGADHAPGVPVAAADELSGASILPQGSDPLTTETTELALDGGDDPWLAQACASATSSLVVDDAGGVRLALVVGDQVGRGFGGLVDVRVVLHRVPTCPVIALVLGPPAALRVPSPTQLAVVALDIASDHDRAVLAALATRFELTVDMIARGSRLRRIKLTAPLADNVHYIVRAAEDHLRGASSATGTDPMTFARARDLVRGPGFDLLGFDQADAAEFRDDKLAQLETAQQLRRAIAVARRFARPAREDYLVCTRGFPLPRWRELRRHVLDSAVTWGLWMGPELAQIAVSEGLARSRRDLVIKLDRGFEALRLHPTAFDLDADASTDNATALAAEARALGVEIQQARTGTIEAPDPGRAATRFRPREVRALASDDAPAVSGSIDGPVGLRHKPVDELIALLDDKRQRLDAALTLCERGDGTAATAVIAAAGAMSRADAVRVLGMSVKLGAAVKAPLLEGLASNKSFLRHGCALALALLRTEDGTQAVIDLLMTEPTEIWREVARAIGQCGPSALLPLASTFGKLGERRSPALAERVAWAMAHVAVRGGKSAIETMAGGQSVVAPLARHALELYGSAANDQVRVRPDADGSQPGRDITVNRAFSRRFFEALEQGIPDAGQAGLVDLDASGPMETLEETDIIVDEEVEQLLDESDLIQP